MTNGAFFPAITGDGLPLGGASFRKFDVLGSPQEPGTAVWRADQVYADGVVKRWSGPPEIPGEEAPESAPETPGPASATKILDAAEAPEASPSRESSAGIWLGVIAIGIAGASALGVGLLWSTRPARLPEDDD